MSPREGYVAVIETAVAELRLQASRLAAAAQGLQEIAPEAAEFRPQGFACAVERAPEGVTLMVRMRAANIALPLSGDRARELAALLLLQAEGAR